MIIPLILSHLVRRTSLCNFCRAQYHRTAPLLVRGNYGMTDERKLSQTIQVHVDPSDLLPPRSRIGDEITIDETLDLDKIETRPLRKADPEYIDEMAPEIPISFNVASFVDRNRTMQELVKLGVDLSVLEQNRNVIDFLLSANFDNDIAPFIQFLADVGIKPSAIGSIITRHPVIFDELIVNLRTRVEYLESKGFNRSSIVKIINGHPPFLSKSVKEVDSRLGHLQKEFKLIASQVRHILIQYPQVVSLHPMQIRSTLIVIKEDMGFTPEQMRKMLIQAPSLLGGDRNSMVGIFDSIYNGCKVEHEVMVNFPEVFLGRPNTVERRLEYLKRLKRDQFDPTQPRFIPLSVLADGDDELFARKYARTDIDDYNYFLKSN